jgi:hypothetical protein
MRNAEDPPFQLWSSKDHSNISQQELDDLFGTCYITRQQAEDMLDNDTTILCSHNDQVSTLSYLHSDNPYSCTLLTPLYVLLCRLLDGMHLLYKNYTPMLLTNADAQTDALVASCILSQVQ